MSTYYVTYPNMDISAVVTAPSTDKARTTFLDWLERTGRMSRKNRQRLRRDLVAERLEFPEEVDADVRLNYQYDGVEEQEYEPIQVARELPPEFEERPLEGLEEREPTEMWGKDEEEGIEVEGIEVEPEIASEPEPTGTPIGALATRSAR